MPLKPRKEQPARDVEKSAGHGLEWRSAAVGAAFET